MSLSFNKTATLRSCHKQGWLVIRAEPDTHLMLTSHQNNYLHHCFRSFRNVIERKYGRQFDLPAIERSVKHLRKERPLLFGPGALPVSKALVV